MSSRYEVKYVISTELRNALEPRLRSRMKPDPHGIDGHGLYHVHSVYFDSPGLACYHEKLAGLFARSKVRVRYYDDERNPLVLEIKGRLGPQVLKDRYKLVGSRRAAALRGQRICEDEWHPAVQAYNRAVTHWEYRPKLLIKYTRLAYVAPHLSNLRITFDSRITVQRCRRMDQPDGLAHAILPPQRLVLEIKFDRWMPEWVSQLVQEFSLATQAVSKYCRGAERLMTVGQLEHAAA